jgi:hypothetical protein
MITLSVKPIALWRLQQLLTTAAIPLQVLPNGLEYR